MANRVTALLRKILPSLLLLLAGLLFACGGAELAVRLILPQQLIVQRPELYRPMDSVGYAHRPDVNLTVNTGDRDVQMYTDSNGFRVGSKGRPAGDFRILLLGDSFMAAMNVEYPQSFSGLLEQCFAKRTGKSVAVWNAGVAGWDPPQYYVQARRALATGQFDAVLVSVFLGNDVVERLHYLKPFQADARKSFHVIPRRLSWSGIIDAWLYPLNDMLEARSHLFVFFKQRMQAVLMRAGLTPVEVPPNLRKSEATSTRWAVTADILAGIDSAAKVRGIPTMYMLIPAIEQVMPDVLAERAKSFKIDPASLDLDQPDRLMAAELEKRKLTLVDLLPLLREAQQRKVDLYGRADMHPSPAGHRIMWNGAAPLLAQTLKLPYSVPADSAAPCSMP
jgi:hypothetical protein